MITLAGLELSDDLIWEARESDFGPSALSANSAVTLGGRMVVWERGRTGGRPIDLVGTMESGWITGSQLSQLAEWAATVGWRGLLVYESVSVMVRFRHEDPPVLDVSPLIPRPNSSSTDYYHGRIKLAEV